MKIQTTALIDELTVDGRTFSLPDEKSIDLEFSAIDTGGGFKDPILDFSFRLQSSRISDWPEAQAQEIILSLQDPGREGNKAELSYEGGVLDKGEALEVNGRLKEEQLSRQLIGFVLKLLR